jgi:hypothetical protein
MSSLSQQEEHVLHVRQVLQALQDNELINREKCLWGLRA